METDTFLHGLAVVVMVVGMSVSIYYRRRANRKGGSVSAEKEGFWILNLRKIFGGLAWLSILTYLINPDWMAWSSLPLPAGLRWLGAGLMVASLPLLVWMFTSLGDNITPTVATRQEHRLVTHGPYRWVRHPLYSIGFLLFTGLSLLAANWFLFLMLILTFIILFLRTAIEEAMLVEKFGNEYREYMQQTGRFFPRLWRPALAR